MDEHRSRLGPRNEWSERERLFDRSGDASWRICRCNLSRWRAFHVLRKLVPTVARGIAKKRIPLIVTKAMKTRPAGRGGMRARRGGRERA